MMPIWLDPARLWGTFVSPPPCPENACELEEETGMGGLIYLIGLIVVIMFILSFLGLR
jgi:hypothetical protein